MILATLALLASMTLDAITGAAAIAAVAPEEPLPPYGTTRVYRAGVTTPGDITVAADGAVWFTNQIDHVLTRVDPDGTTSFLSDPRVHVTDLLPAADGSVWFASQAYDGPSFGRIDVDGRVTVFPLKVVFPDRITWGADGAVWYLAGGSRVGRITTSGVHTPLIHDNRPDKTGITAGPDGKVWFTTPEGPGSPAEIGRYGLNEDGSGIKRFTHPRLHRPSNIVAGPDGALWFANGAGSIGRVTVDGQFSFVDDPRIPWISDLIVGSDSALWFAPARLPTERHIGRLTTSGSLEIVSDPAFDVFEMAKGVDDGSIWFTRPSTGDIGRYEIDGGTVSTVALPPLDDVGAITRGAGDAQWFTNGSNDIGRVTADGWTTLYSSPAIDHPNDLVEGSDGAMWFTNAGAGTIGRMTETGDLTTFADPRIKGPAGITAGPDGALWFANEGAGTIGRLTTDGQFAFFGDDEMMAPHSITAGADGALWFTEPLGDAIGRIDTAGTLTVYQPEGLDGPIEIERGPDEAVWFTTGGKVGRLTVDGSFSTYLDPTTMTARQQLAVGPDGAMWLHGSASGTGAVIRISMDGEVRAAKSDAFGNTRGISADDRSVWVTQNGQIFSSLVRFQVIGAPGPPASVGAIAGAGAASVSWSPPPVDGGAPITGYEVIAQPGGSSCVAPATATSCVVPGLDPDWDYGFEVRASNSHGAGTFAGASARVVPNRGASFHALTPTRILDSRTSLGGFDGPLVFSAPKDLLVAGAVNIPRTASAVLLNVTVTQPTANSFLTLWPSTKPKPTTSSHNFAKGQTVANTVLVRPGANGMVRFATAFDATHVVADVLGYFDDGFGEGDGFTGITPRRVLDSRTATGGWAGPLPAGSARSLVVTGGAVPPSASAIVANVTVTDGTVGSFVRAWPTGSPPPAASSLNFAGGQTTSNLLTLPVGDAGSVTFANEFGAVQLVVDVVGFYDRASPHRFHALVPTRFLDDRVSLGAVGPWGPGQTRSVPVGPAIVPEAATAIAFNLTATNGTTGSFVRTFGMAGDDPITSTINFGPGATVPNGAIVQIGDDRAIRMYNELGHVDLVADAAGYFAP